MWSQSDWDVGGRRHRARHAARRRVRTKVNAGLRVEAAVLSKAMDGKPVKVTDARGRPAPLLLHTVSVEHLERRRWQGQAGAWLHRTVAPTIISTFNAAAKNEAGFELGMGVINVPFAIRNVRIENPEATPTRGSAGSDRCEHSPCVAIQSFVAELAGGRPRPKDFLLEVIGPAVRSGRRRLAMRGTTAKRRSVPWTPAGCDEWWRRSPTRPAGQEVAQAPRSGHRCPLQLPELHRGGREVAVDEEGELTIRG